jgi:Skp family chaperone for outer membrane proteins
MPFRNTLLAVMTLSLLVIPAQSHPSGKLAAKQGPASRVPSQVAVVDLQTLERAVGGAVEAFQQQRLAAVNAKFEEMRALQLRIIREKDTLGPEVCSQMQQQVQQLKKETAQEEQAAFRDVQGRRAAQRATLQEHLARVAAARGFQLVLNRGESAVLWSDPGIDVTDDVIKSLTNPAR